MTISMLSWLWLLGISIFAISQMNTDLNGAQNSFLTGVAIFLIADVTAWILTEFSNLPKDNNGLIRPLRLFKKIISKK